MSTPPTYVNGHGLLAGKKVLVTAAAGTGIGFQAAKRAIEEGAQVAKEGKAGAGQCCGRGLAERC
jgi:3-oxoacyl-[acyl-carrier protein] reductase